MGIREEENKEAVSKILEGVGLSLKSLPVNTGSRRQVASRDKGGKERMDEWECQP